ncbi:hypothetical protein H8K35_01155 [Undibacterium sp. LX40W]|uniref:Glycosyl hydrolase n=1 Tax=Undibacterium nitidum TaxID=2762298 RepID=A0A923KT78_9BURK|nr:MULTISPECIES: hypothetical protein [Undibacterium]MBC3881012.1 hypothetical protein [Undibacterium nitidum]MBC3890255.1 hypothetical protein [Undibacterium sp. LX40W]
MSKSPIRGLSFFSATRNAAALICLLPALALAQSGSAWNKVDAGVTVELRGLSVVSKDVAWASGAKGTVLRTVDGQRWTAMNITGAEKLDFRDIQGFDAKTAIAMSAGPGKASTLYKTVDGGTSWELLKVNGEETGFWDAMDFWDKNHGIVFGDPVNGSFQVLVTNDGGRTWINPVKDAQQLAAMPNEGAFAASGTCISVLGTQEVWFVTGGAAKSRIFHSRDGGKTWEVSTTEVPAAAPPKGLFSVSVAKNGRGFAVGGDYQQAKGAGLNAMSSRDGGKTWQATPALPQGFMSVVSKVPGSSSFVVGGLAGSGVSKDFGKTWTVLGETPLNALGFADGTHGWAVGPKGLILQYVGVSL